MDVFNTVDIIQNHVIIINFIMFTRLAKETCQLTNSDELCISIVNPATYFHKPV